MQTSMKRFLPFDIIFHQAHISFPLCVSGLSVSVIICLMADESVSQNVFFLLAAKKDMTLSCIMCISFDKELTLDLTCGYLFLLFS